MRRVADMQGQVAARAEVHDKIQVLRRLEGLAKVKTKV